MKASLHKKKTSVKVPFKLLAASVLTASVLAACGGGAGGNGANTASTSNGGASQPGTQPVQSMQLTGTVAVGRAVANANVTVIDVNGKSVTASANVSGNYTASIAGLSAPFLIVAADPAGNETPLYSVVATAPDSTAPTIANVTTLTTAVTAQLTTSGNPLELTTSGQLAAQVTASSVNASVVKLRTALAPILAANGVSTTAFDPIGTAFATNHQGLDAVVDSVSVVPAPSGGTQLISIADPNSAIVLNDKTSVSATLVVPSVAADYLSPLIASLSQCLQGTSTACASAVDSTYLEAGFHSFLSAHPELSAAGVTLGDAKTLAFFAPGELMAGSNSTALVRFFYTTANGVTGNVLTVVQKTAAGTWDIVGNQVPYNVNITSGLQRRTFLDPANAPFSRYESGILIDIPLDSTNPSNVYTAVVTGPGISGAAYLVRPNASGYGSLALSTNVLTSVPATPITSDSGTNYYRFSWTALPTASSTFAPGTNNGRYSPQSVDVASIGQFARYSVSLYDSTGAQIGRTFSVVNATPVMAAATGAGIAWQSLSNDFMNAYFAPNGSLAAAQSQLTLAWSNLFGGQNIAPLVTQGLIQTQTGNGIIPLMGIDSWSQNMPTALGGGQYSVQLSAGVNEDGTAECSGCQFAAQAPGSIRYAALQWTNNGTLYMNAWRYQY
ncbi:hypothetical protein BJG93_27085 [Paraburkholderia sprentiae WSM5005]|uniref:Cell wall anchor protein n=1 Tax=Paraburkholderia sprentiae WSM5005 TaxID=754502 RepID=A0A1I9YRW0_9BURK|nr:hypothetical protein [Paraburkholderia sprentiae]APA88944.1 hypothetical protein BJG93_27085 [Paraburkholderia sprentiae WSM5005]